MAEYRKKPVVVEAVQWKGTAATATPIIDWILKEGGTARYHEPPAVLGDIIGNWADMHRLAIDTLEGIMMAAPGDWVIRGVKGEFYPCKPDIFEVTYEAADTVVDAVVVGDVVGYCPMGCGRTLFLGDGGYVTCSHVDCPRPDAVAALLKDQETEHIVVIEEHTFSIQHPLRERLDGELFVCGLHAWISALSGPPKKSGRYRVAWLIDARAAVWEALP